MIIRDIKGRPHRRVVDQSLICELELIRPDHPRVTDPLPFSIAHAIVPPCESTLPHRLKESTERYYIIGGTGEMHVGVESADVRAGQIILIPTATLAV